MDETDKAELADPHRPIRTLTYQLSAADALAYSQLQRELTGWEKFRFVLWIFAGGMVIGFLPQEWPRLVWWPAALGVGLVAFLLAVAMLNWSTRYRVRKMPLPTGKVVLEEWGDHLAERSSQGQHFVAYETIAQVIETPDHVFVRSGDVPLIVPKAAFRDKSDMLAFAQHVDELSKAAQP